MSKLSTLGYGVVASLALIGNVASAEDSVTPPPPQLEGAWQVIVTLRMDAADCTTAPIVQDQWNPFASFNTFHRGGTMSEYGTRSPPSSRTSGHGVWKRTGYQTFEARHVFITFAADDTIRANMDVRSDIKVAKHGRTFKGVGRLVATDLAGNSLQFCATLVGDRIRL